MGSPTCPTCGTDRPAAAWYCDFGLPSRFRSHALNGVARDGWALCPDLFHRPTPPAPADARPMVVGGAFVKFDRPTPADDARIYPCADCGLMRSRSEGGATFTVCDVCWDKAYPTAPAPDEGAGCVCGEPATKGVVHRTDGPCFHRPGPRWDADPLTPEDHAKCAAEHHPAPADVGDDDPACTCAPLGKATCVKHAPTPDAGAAERAEFEAWAASDDYYCDRHQVRPEEYENSATQCAWEAWQASRAALRGTKGGAE